MAANLGYWNNITDGQRTCNTLRQTLVELSMAVQRIGRYRLLREVERSIEIDHLKSRIQSLKAILAEYGGEEAACRD